MRTLMLFLVAVPLAGPAAAQGPATPIIGKTPDRCAPTVDKTRGPRISGSMKLGDQPPADHLLAIYRRGPDGCPVPVVLRKGIGANHGGPGQGR